MKEEGKRRECMYIRVFCKEALLKKSLTIGSISSIKRGVMARNPRIDEKRLVKKRERVVGGGRKGVYLRKSA